MRPVGRRRRLPVRPPLSSRELSMKLEGGDSISGRATVWSAQGGGSANVKSPEMMEKFKREMHDSKREFVEG